MANAPQLDAAFVEKQRLRLTKVRADLAAEADDDESEEGNVRSESAASGSREYEDDAQRLDMLEREGNLVVRNVGRLEQVDRALKKIEEGTYGVSDQSGQPIPRERLEAVPESIYTFAEENAREAKR
jgi:DnaK suppressor protein